MKRLSVLFLCAVSCALAAEQPVAVLRQSTGDVAVRHGQWAPVSRVPMDLYDGDKVVTNRGRAEIFYPSDGSLLTLDVGTNMTIHHTASSGGGWLRRVEVFVGDVFFHVSKTAETRNRWQLATPTAVGGVIGTEGQIHVESDQEARFSLAEGTLEVTRLAPDGKEMSEPPLRIGPGEAVHAVLGRPLRQMPLRAALKPPRLDLRPEELPKPGKHVDRVRESERPPALQRGGKQKPPKPKKPPKVRRRG